MSAGRRIPLAVVAVIAALAVGVGAGALLFGGDDDVTSATDTTTAGPAGDGASTTTATTEATAGSELPPTTVDTAGLSGDALALAEAINRAHQLTYRATFENATPEGTTVVEVWRRLPEARRDTRLGAPPDQIHTREYRTADGRHVGCIGPSEPTEGEEQCFVAPPTATDPADPVLGSVDPSAGTVVARDDVVRDIEVRCFTVTTAEGTVQEACFDDDGIPAAIDGGDGRLERVELERGVTSEDLAPPEVTTASPAPPAP